jgi:hypothetical protein
MDHSKLARLPGADPMLPLYVAIVSFTTDRENTVKRALASLGIAGLALFSVTAPANAADSAVNGQVSGGNNQHAGNGHGSGNNGNGNGNGSGNNGNGNGHGSGHDDHGNGNGNGNGGNGNGHGSGHDEHGNGGNGNGHGSGHDDHGNGNDDGSCNPESPPVEPPVVEPPVIEPPAVVPPVVVPPAGLPLPAEPVITRVPVVLNAAAVPPAAVSRGTNQGFNAQTAAGGAEDSNTWLAGMDVLLGAGVVVTVRRRSRSESPTAG